MSAIHASGSSVKLKKALAILQRIAFTVLAVYISIAVPQFSAMMAFLGSFSAFLLAIVGPVLAKVVIDGKCGLFDAIVIAIGAISAIWGTLAAFWSAA